MLAIMNSGLDSWRGVSYAVSVISLPSEPHLYLFSTRNRTCVTNRSVVLFYFPQFVEDGVFQKEADMHRLRVQFGEDEAQKIKARELREKRHMEHLEKLEQEAAMDPNLVPIGERPSAARGASAARPVAPLDDIPDVEWWDKDILQNGSYDDVSHGKWNVNMDKFNLYVEHPIPIQPPLAPPAPASQPLMLTKAEQKKLRTQRRVAREKEKQEMIKQGLIEPPKPKVKISNLMRVMKDEAILDPTAIEREVREQMAEREQAHLDRNLARMLTPAERKEKKMRKLIGGDAAGEVHMHVYRIEDMSNTKNKFKVDINAQENHLAGTYYTRCVWLRLENVHVAVSLTNSRKH